MLAVIALMSVRRSITGSPRPLATVLRYYRYRGAPVYVCLWPILLKNCSRLGQCGFAGGHKPSPGRVAFNGGHSMRSNFVAASALLRQPSFSTESVVNGRPGSRD